MNNLKLEKIINKYLQINLYKDHVPNGLQIEGTSTIKKIITGVTASQDLLNKAVELKSDAIIVHHGFFWKNEPIQILNMKKKRIKTILCNNINLYSYHLPLDIHPIIGNNIQIGNIIDVKDINYILPILPIGKLEKPIKPEKFKNELKKKFKKKPLYIGNNKKVIKKIAWCSGSGQNLLQKAAQFGADAFITGEVSEQVFHIAKEMDINFYSIGHHTTETYGIQALGNWLKKKYGFSVNFINIFNPI